jgi:hypothetical protein
LAPGFSNESCSGRRNARGSEVGERVHMGALAALTHLDALLFSSHTPVMLALYLLLACWSVPLRTANEPYWSAR